MIRQIICCAALLCMTVVLSRSTTRRFLDVNCNEKLNCSEEHVPVCGTDGQTYNNKCLVELENQKKVCFVGDFNPVMVVHDGPCNDTIVEDS